MDRDPLEIEIPDDLLAEAVAAVERRTQRPERGSRHRRLLGVAVPAEIDEFVVPPELAQLTDPPIEPDTAPNEALSRLEHQLQLQIKALEARAQKAEADLRQAQQGRDEIADNFRLAQAQAEKLAKEYERLRTRSKKERDEAERAAEERALKPLLETADNLERALTHAEPSASPLAKGLSMVLEALRSQLRKLGVERVPSEAGSPFDPSLHEAVMFVATDLVDSGRILSEVVPGYRLRERLLRPARVTVAAPMPVILAPSAPEGTGDEGPDEAPAFDPS